MPLVVTSYASNRTCSLLTTNMIRSSAELFCVVKMEISLFYWDTGSLAVTTTNSVPQNMSN